MTSTGGVCIDYYPQGYTNLTEKKISISALRHREWMVCYRFCGRLCLEFAVRDKVLHNCEIKSTSYRPSGLNSFLF